MRARSAKAGIGFLASIAVLSIVLPPILSAAGADAYAIDPGAIYRGPSLAHVFGTDDLGRDVFARLLVGARTSLLVAVLGTSFSLVVGSALGLLAGWLGGAWDAILSRFTEGMMALPRLPLMIIFAAVDLEKVFGTTSSFAKGSGASILKLVVVIVLFGWMSAARLCRASTLQLKNAEFVQATRALGASDRRILLRHVLPNAAGPLFVLGALELGEIILYESVLSFLGLGISPPLPSWGQMLAQGMTYLESAPLLLVLPGLLTFLTVASFNALADHMRDVLDPKTREQV